jgi:hypothetical protein
MINCNAPPKIPHRILLTATAIFLLAGTEGSVARGGSNFGDHGGMKTHEFGTPHEGMKTQKSHRDRDRRDNESQSARKREDRHQDADERAAKMKDKEKATPTADSGKDLFGKGIVGKTPTDIKPIPGSAAPGTAGNNTIHPIVTNNPAQDKDKAPSTPAAPGTAGNNTIHPIVTNNPKQPSANAPTSTGQLPPNDPVGNTRPTPGPNPPTVVSVSNGVTTTRIQNGLGGVTVFSDKPGTITVSNGKESTTLNGASVTLSGNVVGVGGGQGVEVRPRNGEGNTVVAIKSAPQASPSGLSSEDNRKAFYQGCGPCEVLEGISDFGYGVAHGFAPGAAPPPATSTIQQQ